MAALVSVLVPAFNAERWIGEAIASALAQTWPRKEVIVVNDGSRDATLEAARKFESGNVKVLTQENRGASAARNAALAIAQGDYIQWLDADDVLAPDKVSLQMAAAQRAGTDRELLSCGYGVFHYRLHKARFTPTPLWKDLAPIDWIVTSYCERAWMVPAVWLVSRRLTEAAGPWNEALSQNDDGEYVSRMVLASTMVRFVPEAKCFYRSTGFDQLSRVSTEKSLRSLFLSLTLCIDELLAAEDSARTRRACLDLLQMYLPSFDGDERTLGEYHALAARLGGKLRPAAMGWKGRTLTTLLGRREGTKAITALRKLRLAAAVKWDEFRAR